MGAGSAAAPARTRADTTARASAGLLVLAVHLTGVLAWWALDRAAAPVPDRTALAPLTVWLPALPVLAPLPPAPDEPAATAEAAATPAPALNLSLPRQVLVGQAPTSAAALSPFHGRLPASVEQIIANAAAESGPWTEERIDSDHIRLRRGTTCVLMERPAAAALDTFSGAARRMPWRVSATRC